MRMRAALVALLATCTPACKAAGEKIAINFEQASILPDPTNDEIVTRPESWTDQGVVFTLAREPARSRARGRLMFFPHVPSGRKGILNAMADEQEIPVRVRFPRRASEVAIEFWASTGAAARLEAFDAQGAVVARDAVDVVPSRKAPEEPIPMFTLAVRAPEIAYVEFSGPRTGEFLAAASVRVTLADIDKPIVIGEFHTLEVLDVLGQPIAPKDMCQRLVEQGYAGGWPWQWDEHAAEIQVCLRG